MAVEPAGTPGDRKEIPTWILVVTLVVVSIMAGGPAWYLASKAATTRVTDEAVTTDKGTGRGGNETTAEAESTAETADTAVTADTAAEPLPSYVRYAYVRAVTGSPGAWEASVDLFDIFTGAEADAYAANHGMTVPGNGILYVNESETPESVSLSDAAVITYNTGGVEELETHSATIEQLRDYAAGSTTAMPDAFRDQWKVTVVEGAITRIEMIAVAD